MSDPMPRDAAESPDRPPGAPRISVLIGAYNNADTLERAARSILEQTVSQLELILIDDGSSDGTAQVMAAIAGPDPRVRSLSMGRNTGIARSLNEGLHAARAPVVAVQDADDWSEPHRLERQLAVLEACPGVAVVGGRMREVDPGGRELAPRTRFASGHVEQELLRFNPIPNTCAAFRRALALELGGYDPRYRYAMEHDLWLRMADDHRVVTIDETLATRQMGAGNVAARREREQLSETLAIRVRTLRRRRTLRGAAGLVAPAVSLLTPLSLKRARRRRLGQAP
jgi:glycosyltransferase involved in cell wall biosynthesis